MIHKAQMNYGVARKLNNRTGNNITESNARLGSEIVQRNIYQYISIDQAYNPSIISVDH